MTEPNKRSPRRSTFAAWASSIKPTTAKKKTGSTKNRETTPVDETEDKPKSLSASARARMATASLHDFKNKGKCPVLRPANPSGRPSYMPPIRLYFMQRTDGGQIKIARLALDGEEMLLRLHDAEGARPHILRVGSFTDAQARSVLKQLEPQENPDRPSWFEPTQGLLDFIAEHTRNWSPPLQVLAPDPPKKKSATESRICKECEMPFNTTVKNVLCSECTKALRARMREDRYLTPNQWYRRGGGGGSAGEFVGGDPSPWMENAVRELEDQ